METELRTHVQHSTQAEKKELTVSQGAREEWFWEGNVQQAIVRYLRAEGFTVEHSSDIVRGEHGPDIIARRNGRLLPVEVKGYPSRRYVKGNRSGLNKPTQPTRHAPHWFAEALTSIIRRRTQNGEAELAMAFPDMKRYRVLLEETRWALRRLEVRAYLVHQDGAVEEFVG